MSRPKLVLSWIACAWLAACGDNHQAPKDAAPAADAPADAGGDAALAPCIDRPTDLPQPPTGALPCELLPPGFAPPK
jgi:hypothetical protein